MDVIDLDRKDYTVAEYIALQESSEHKLEYHDGQIFMMAGASPEHSRIVANLSGLLYDNPQDCEMHPNDQAVSFSSTNKYLYPDLSFVCNKETGSEYDEENRRFLLNPCLLIEVLSVSTADYDRVFKFTLYRSLPSFREYVLIDSRKMQVESYYRNDDKTWTIQNLWLPEQELTFHSLGKSLTLQQIYRRTEIEPMEFPIGPVVVPET